MIDKVRLEQNSTELVIELDSIHSDTFGKQEATNYNAHHSTNGYHPLVAFDGLTEIFLKSELYSVNVYASNGGKRLLVADAGTLQLQPSLHEYFCAGR